MGRLYKIDLFGADIGFSYFDALELIDLLGLKKSISSDPKIVSLIKKHGKKHRIVGIAMRQAALFELEDTLNSKFLPYDSDYNESGLRFRDQERQYESEEKLLWICWSLVSAKSINGLKRLNAEYSSKELRSMHDKGQSLYRYFRNLLNENTRDYINEYKLGHTDRDGVVIRGGGGDYSSSTTPIEATDEVKKKRLASQPTSVSSASFTDEVVNAARLMDAGVILLLQQIQLLKQGKVLDFQAVTSFCAKLIASYSRNSFALLAVRHQKNTENYLAQHALACAVLACHLAHVLKLERRYIEVIVAGALLFDIGRFKLPDVLRDKSGKLTEEEFSLMRKHIQFGDTLLSINKGLPKIIYLMLWDHHERIDGAGYPNGKESNEISVYGKIAAIIDAYDALTSYQPFKPPLTPVEALQSMSRESGLAFDKHVFLAFKQSLGSVPVGSCVELSNGRLAFVLTLNKNYNPALVRQVYSLTSRSFMVSVDLPLDRSEGIEVLRVVLPSDYGLQFVDHLS